MKLDHRLIILDEQMLHMETGLSYVSRKAYVQRRLVAAADWA